MYFVQIVELHIYGIVCFDIWILTRILSCRPGRENAQAAEGESAPPAVVERGGPPQSERSAAVLRQLDFRVKCQGGGLGESVGPKLRLQYSSDI